MIADRLLTASLALTLAASANAQTHVYVDDDAPAGGNGLSWQSAFNDLHDAIELAKNLGQNRGEIRIAGGTYKPDQGTGNVDMPFFVPSPGIGESLFVLKGGYTGLARPISANVRDLVRYPTTLSGDLAENDLPGEFNREDNSNIILEFGVEGVPSGQLASGVILDGIGFRGAAAHAIMNPFVRVGAAFSNCTFTENHGLDGSAVRLNEAVVLLSACVFQFNTSSPNSGYPLFAGAVNATRSSIGINNCEFKSNTATAGAGGGLAIENSYVSVNNTIFDDNHAPQGAGGGLYFYSPEDPPNDVMEVQYSSFMNNTAQSGGGIGAVGRAYIRGSDITHNHATYGGGVQGEMALSDCVIEDNTAARNAGGLYLGRESWISGCEVRRNKAEYGGGMSTWSPGPTIYDSVFEFNEAEVNGGGCLYVKSITQSRFAWNVAGNSGGGAAFTESVSSSLFEKNIAQYGGGFYVQGPYYYSTISDSAFIDNRAFGTGSSIQVDDGSGLDLIRSACVQSAGPRGDGSVSIDEAYLWIESSIIWDHQQSGVPTVKLRESNAGVLYSIMRQSTDALELIGNSDVLFLSGNIDADPRFVDPVSGDISLKPNSPCIDRGYHAPNPELSKRDVYGAWRDPHDDPGIMNLGFGVTKVLDIGPVEFRGETCLADTNSDGQLSIADFSAWIAAFNTQDPVADQNMDGTISATDFSAWLFNYNSGCP